MAFKRPFGRALPMGMAKRPFQQVMPRSKTNFAPGAGERPPQGEVFGGFTLPGGLPTHSGSTGLAPFFPGNPTKRSFQQLTARRLSPFFIATPAAAEAPSPGGFAPAALPTPVMGGATKLGRGNALPKVIRDARAKAKASGSRVGVGLTPEVVAFIKKQRMLAKKKNGGLTGLNVT